MEQKEVITLINETRESLLEYIPKLLDAIDKMVTDLQTGKDSWIPLFESFLEGISWTIEAIQGIKNVNANVLTMIDMKGLNAQILEMKQALEQQDFVLLTDMLQYELKPLLETYWTEIKKGV